MNVEDLLNQYVNTGLSIPESQFNKLNSNMKKTYLRKRLISFKHTRDIHWEINYVPYQTQVEIVKKNVEMARYIKNPTEEIKLISHNRTRGINNLPYQDQLEIVREDWRTIKHVENQTEEMQLEVIKQSLFAIDLLRAPTELVQFEVVKRNPDMIRGIRNPTERVIQYVKDQAKLIENIQRIKKLLI